MHVPALTQAFFLVGSMLELMKTYETINASNVVEARGYASSSEIWWAKSERESLKYTIYLVRCDSCRKTLKFKPIWTLLTRDLAVSISLAIDLGYHTTFHRLSYAIIPTSNCNYLSVELKLQSCSLKHRFAAGIII